MSDDFAPFPLAVALQDHEKLIIEIKNPDMKELVPKWGNHCLWTDPPPKECFPDSPLNPFIRMGSDQISKIDIANLSKGFGNIGKVSPDVDIDSIPPHLRPLVKTLSDFINKNQIDIENLNGDGMTVIFHKKE